MMIRATLVLVLALELATAQFSGFSDEFDSDFSYYKWDPMPSAQRSDSAVFITGTGVSLGLTQAFNLNTAGTDAINVTLSWTPNVLIPMDEDVMIAVWCERDLVFAFPSPLYLLLIVTRRYPPRAILSTTDPATMSLATWESETQPCDSCGTGYLADSGTSWQIGGGSCVAGELQDETGCTIFFADMKGRVDGANVCDGQDCGTVCRADSTCDPTTFLACSLYGYSADGVPCGGITDGVPDDPSLWGDCCADTCDNSCNPSTIADATYKAVVQQTLTVTASSVRYTNNMGCSQPNVATDFASGTDFYVYVVQVGRDTTRERLRLLPRRHARACASCLV